MESQENFTVTVSEVVKGGVVADFEGIRAFIPVSKLSLVNEKRNVQMHYEIHDVAMKNYIQTRSKLLKESNSELACDHIKAINMAMDLQPVSEASEAAPAEVKADDTPIDFTGMKLLLVEDNLVNREKKSPLARRAREVPPLQ